MRAALSVLVLCFMNLLSTVLTAAPTRLALIGDPDMVDPVTAELSGNNTVVLLERNGIDKVLSEHRLQDLGFSIETLSKHFPHADVFAVLTGERLVVFNAKNGSRLWDSPSGRDAEKILLALEKLAKPKPLYLSMVSVRDVAVPHRMKGEIERFVIRFEQELLQDSAIQILERSRLDSVNRERALSGKDFSLLASARLLTLEFEPGSDTAIELRLIIRDLENRQLNVFEQRDVFRDLPGSAAVLARKVAFFLTDSQLSFSDRKKEAARFFGEYQAAQEDTARKEKLAAALALDPMNERYRFEEMDLDSPGWDAHIERLKRCEEKFPAFRRDFPKSTKNLSYLISPERYSNYFPEASKDQLKFLEDYCERIRPWYDEALKRELPFDLDDGIGSLAEMRNYQEYLWRSSDMTMFWNFERGYRRRYENQVKLIRAWDRFIADNPQYGKRAESYYFIVSRMDWNRHWEKEIFDQYIRYLKSIRDFSPLAASTDLPGAHAAGAILEAQLNLLEAKSVNEACSVYFEMFDAFRKIQMRYGTDEFLRPDHPVLKDCFSVINSECFQIRYPRNFVEEERKRYFRMQGEKDRFSLDDFRNLTTLYRKNDSENYFQMIAGYLDQIRVLWPIRLTRNDGAVPFIRLSDQIFVRHANELNKSYIRKIVDGLNPDFDLEIIPYSRFLNCPLMDSPVRCLAASRSNSEILLVLTQNDKVVLAVLDQKLNRIEQYDLGDKFPPIENYVAWDTSHPCYRLDADQKTIVVGGSGELRIIDRKNKQINRLSGLWEDWTLAGLALHSGKIFLAAKKAILANAPGKIMMKSAALDGSMQKIHFHSNRSRKQSAYDGIENAMICGFDRLPEGNIIIAFTSKDKNANSREKHQLLLFEIGTEQIRPLSIQLPFPLEGIKWTSVDTEGKYLYSGGVFNDLMVKVDPETSRWEAVFKTKSAKGHFPSQYDLDQLTGLTPPFLPERKQLWCAGEMPMVVSLDAPEKSPILFLPPDTRNIFKLNDRVAYFGDANLITVKIKTVMP